MMDVDASDEAGAAAAPDHEVGSAPAANHHAPDKLVDPDIDVELTRPPAVSERYYQGARFVCDIKSQQSHDQFVLQHSNGLCVVGIAPSHPLRTPGGPRPKSVVFRKDTLSKKPSGKKKIGATWMNELTPLCDVTCTDDSTFIIYACVRGNLYEVNRRLVDNPGLIVDGGDTEGYVAIIMPKRDEKKTATTELLTHEQYNARIAGPAQPSPAI